MAFKGKSIKRLSFSLVAAGAVLVGCSSFNNSFNRYIVPVNNINRDDSVDEEVKLLPDTLVQTPGPSVPAAPAEVKPAGTAAISNTCEYSPYITDIPMPEIPTKEIQAAPDLAAIEKIERRHINELRQYINDVRKAHREVKARFYEKCAVISK